MEIKPKNTQPNLRKNTEPPLIRYLLSKAIKSATPISGTFELTPRCNFDCKMCYVHLTKGQQTAIGKELTADQWLSIGSDAVNNGMLMLLLTGGEPLLRPDFREIFLGLKNMGVMVSINTNGSLIDDDMLSFFKENPPYKINVSLYGSSPETYERLCGNASGFYKTMHALKTLKQYDITTKVNLSITNYNADDVDGIFSIGNEIGLHIQTASYMFPPMRRSHDMIGYGERFTPEEAARMKIKIHTIRMDDEKFLEYCESIDNGVKVIDEDAECLDVPTLEEETPTEHIRCRAGRCTFWITWDGRMLPCGMMEKPSVSVLDLGFAESWKRTAEATQQILMPAKCTSCDKRFACEVCGASCYCETGAFDQDAPQYLCEYTDHYIRLMGEEYRRRLELSNSKK